MAIMVSLLLIAAIAFRLRVDWHVRQLKDTLRDFREEHDTPYPAKPDASTEPEDIPSSPLPSIRI